MTEKAPIDLDAALEALARAERVARPRVSDRLRARVLADAAEVSAGRRVTAAAPARPARARWGGWLGGLDLWAGAAVAAALICLAVGLGVGYQAGEAVLAQVGLGDARLARAADYEVAVLSEDVL
jgi:hypothetical protein